MVPPLLALPVSQLNHDHLPAKQEGHPILCVVLEWVKAGCKVDHVAIAHCGLELKALHSQWDQFVLRDGLLYRRWARPCGLGKLFQLIVPGALRDCVLGLIHGHSGSGHFRVSKTLQRLPAGSTGTVVTWTESYLYIAATKKDLTRCSQTLLQDFWVGHLWSILAWILSGRLRLINRGNRYVLVAMDFFTKWPVAFAVPDQGYASH